MNVFPPAEVEAAGEVTEKLVATGVDREATTDDDGIAVDGAVTLVVEAATVELAAAEVDLTPPLLLEPGVAT